MESVLITKSILAGLNSFKKADFGVSIQDQSGGNNHTHTFFRVYKEGRSFTIRHTSAFGLQFCEWSGFEDVFQSRVFKNPHYITKIMLEFIEKGA